jgi:hypothetical protein
MNLAEYHLLVVICSNTVECETNASDILKRRGEHDRQVRDASLWSLAVVTTFVTAATAAIDLAHLMVVVLELKVCDCEPRPAAITRQLSVTARNDPVGDIAASFAIARVGASSWPPRFRTRGAHVQRVI